MRYETIMLIVSGLTLALSGIGFVALVMHYAGKL